LGRGFAPARDDTLAAIANRNRALAAVCDTFVPGGSSLPSASALGIPARIIGEILALDRPALIKELDQVLDLIESPIANLALAARPTRFSALSQAAREAYLRRWAESPIGLKRQAFQVLKRLTLLYTYGAEGSPYAALTGYVPTPLDAPAEPPRLALGHPAPGETIEADACVIGSGAGGATVAALLAAAHKRVVVLERAQVRTERTFDGRELNGFASLYLDRGIASTEDKAIAILAGSAVGGGTVVNWSTSLRLPASVREEWALAGIDDDLDPDYAAVESRLDIDTGESPRNGPNAALERGLRELNLEFRTIPRNVRGCGDCGRCGFGCRRGAKQSTLRTYLVDACRDGAQVLEGCAARRIEVRDGRVEAVTVRTDGGEFTVRAPLVALAAGAIGSPAILLRSGIAIDRAGQTLYLHPTTAVSGIYADPTPAWEGVPQSVVCEAFADLVPGYGFRLECPPVLPGLLAASIPWWDSDQHRAQAAQAAHSASFIVLVRDRNPGSVTVDRDGRPLITYRVGEQEQRHLVVGMIAAARVHLAAGARRVGSLHTPPVELDQAGDRDAFEDEVERRGVVANRVGLFSAHQMSTCRIGRDRLTSVADPDGQVWEAKGLYVTDASAFPTSSGVNPMLTIMALARRTARRMAR
jgi:choline dehydrogenase-like flavoprotein